GAAAEAAFDQVYKKHGVPDDVPEFELLPEHLVDGRIRLARLLALAGLAGSTESASPIRIVSWPPRSSATASCRSGGAPGRGCSTPRAKGNGPPAGIPGLRSRMPARLGKVALAAPRGVGTSPGTRSGPWSKN